MAKELNLVRLGHYFTPMEETVEGVRGTCRTALVVNTSSIEDNLVGLVMWNYDGGMETRRAVLISEPVMAEDTFHLSSDCPWKR